MMKRFWQVPSGEVLSFGDDTYMTFEEAGVREVRHAAFVLVAGGLGERLGYKGIKVHLIYCSDFPCRESELPDLEMLNTVGGIAIRDNNWHMFFATLYRVHPCFTKCYQSASTR